jgi:septin family protein
MLGFDLSTPIPQETILILAPPQIKIRRKKNVKKGIQFCLMVCGASGTGTSRHTLAMVHGRRQKIDRCNQDEPPS